MPHRLRPKAQYRAFVDAVPSSEGAASCPLPTKLSVLVCQTPLTAKASIGYAMNRMDSELTGDVRRRRIVDATHTALG